MADLRPAMVTFFVAAAMAAATVWGTEQFQQEQDRERVKHVAATYASAIQSNIERGLSATYPLAALVRHAQGNPKDFQSLATEMLPLYKGASALALAPHGVVREIIPLRGNEKAVGHDLMKDPTRDKEAIRARETGELTLAGPFALVQGGLAAAGRLPVYLDSAVGEPKQFWGFVSVLIRFPEVLESANLEQFALSGHAYTLSRVHPDTGQIHAIAESGGALMAPVSLPIVVPNGTWTFSAAPINGWGSTSRVAGKMALALLFSALAGWLASLLARNRRHRQELESRVEEATSELRLQEKVMRSVFDAAPVGISIASPDGRIVSANWRSCEILGLSVDEHLQRHVSSKQWQFVRPDGSVMPPEELPAVRSLKENARIDGVEMGVICDDGLHWLLVNAVPTPDPRLGVIVTFSDISERKRFEAELLAAKAAAVQANHAKSRFLAAASHDLRQPLSALSLFVSVLKTKCAENCTPLVSQIEACIDSLSELLIDLLDISKLDAGVVTPNASDFSVDDLLASLAAIYQGEAEVKGLQLRVRRCAAFGQIDVQLLKRVLGNLVANSIRYSAQGGVLIACRRHKGKHWIEVWDTGIGIAAENFGVIFEEFMQLGDESRNRGSGLGLAIVAKTAAVLGLELRLKSRPGRGSMFAIEIPTGNANAPKASHALERTSRALRIALVDDNTLVLQALTLALERDGHQVIAATNGAELLKRLGSHRPDTVISDYRLAAGETGFDIIDGLRRLFGGELPALLITGDTDPHLVRVMADRGTAVIYKPLQMDALQAFLRACIKNLSLPPIKSPQHEENHGRCDDETLNGVSTSRSTERHCYATPL
jgi:PAS domain S-box-containing protein